jgi:heme oxygenase
MSVSLRSTLKERTAVVHRALESRPLMRLLADGVMSVDEYAEYLRRQHALHWPLEDRLPPWLPSEWVPQRLRKTAWLEGDLAALGERAAPAVAEIPAIDSTAQAMGVMYVLEGSTLGLQVVRKACPPGHPAQGQAGRFLRGYGSATGRHWQEFVTSLDRVPPAQWPVVLDAAHATFAAVARAFD